MVWYIIISIFGIDSLGIELGASNKLLFHVLKVWIAILVTFIVTTVVSWIIVRVNNSRLGVKAPTLGYWVVFYFGLWTSQGMYHISLLG